MSYWIQETSNNHNMSDYRLFYCDRITDIDKLPKFGIEGEQQENDTISHKPCAYGSECKCLQNSSLYILSKDTNEWEIQISNNTQSSSGGSTVITNYEELNNLPKIEGVVIKGDITLDDLGIQPKGNYLTEVPSNYITESQLKDMIQTETQDLDFSTLFD